MNHSNPEEQKTNVLTVMTPSVPEPVPAQEPQKKMSQAEVLTMVDEFNNKLTEICSNLGITITDEDLRICALPGIDQYLSFETKVNYLCDFFNTKHLEMTNVICNKQS
jgi:hypothetical protein